MLSDHSYKANILSAKNITEKNSAYKVFSMCWKSMQNSS